MLNRSGLAAFRLVFVTVVLASCHLAGLLPKYLYFDSIVRTATAVVQPASFWVIDSLTALGAFVLGGAFAQNPGPYATRAALVALSYFLAFAIVSGLITIAWSLIDRRRTDYSALSSWMRLYVRYLLGLVLMGYAVAKIIPTQFGYLGPGELLRSVGHLSRFDMLWTFMSVSPGYTIFAGIIEFVGAFLLFFSRTTLLGALVAGIALMNVVALDIAYEVRGPLLVAILLLLLDVIILLPSARALLRFLLFHRVNDSEVPQQPPARFGLFRWRYWAPTKAILIGCLLSALVLRGIEQRRAYFGAGHSIYGLFDVETLHSSGETAVAAASDSKTWRRVGSAGRVDSGGLWVQFANGDVRQFRLDDDPSNRTWTIRQRAEEFAVVRYDLHSDGTVSLDGRVGGEPVRMRLSRVDPKTYPLLDAK